MKKDLWLQFADGREIYIPCPADETIREVLRLEEAATLDGPETALAFVARLARVAGLLVETARWSAAPAASGKVDELVVANELTLREARQIVNACLAQAQGREPEEMVSSGEAVAAIYDRHAIDDLPLWKIAELAKDT